MQRQQADLEWHDSGVPISKQFNDPYFSLENGLEETRHVFLAGNDLPNRFGNGFQIAELGFGTGLNLLAAWQSWRDAGRVGKLHFTSFEAFPMDVDEMAKSLRLFPVDNALAATLIAGLSNGQTHIQTDDLCFDLVIGDARETVPTWTGLADAWFLDGFSPAKNPELWEQQLLKSVFDHTAPTGTAATYTAAGVVRRGLADAGFAVEKTSGFGRKRHMSVARKDTL